ncbi:CDP-glycerol glycerophosphotransferase family protein [Mangrovactinospora gilvigrisea]|uniref:CDP-glycerol glycerophosphotransferase family protein n=1 Tax=Mangrovactinospora gilvigrisea TaxID=1428644 RepID=UPI001FEA68DE|nr:CDP-glycerol glycerophosphotransferase family protein [Mangrovactinospora gilvigrisea]
MCGVLRLRSRGGLLLALLCAASFAAVPVLALLPSLYGFAVASALSYLTDEWLHSKEPEFIGRLAAFRLNRIMRFLARTASLVILAYRLDATDGWLLAILLVNIAQFGLIALYTGLHRTIRLRRVMPIVVRNLDLSGIRIPKAPSALLYQKYLRRLLHLDVPAHAGVLAALWKGEWRYAGLGFAASLLLTVLAVLLLARHYKRSKRMPTRRQVIDSVNTQLGSYRPEVALYFSFAAVSQDFMYQVNMWIETLEQLDLRPLIILRERASFRFLGRTFLPVVCVPKADDLAELDLPHVRVVLYPGNAGKNVHMLRVAEAKHVFIGHGDSDKLASSNRVSKVYDEIWVAGRAGRDRYQRVRHAISNQAIVEVGRPQLAPILRHEQHTPGPLPVVLYAPTWEGWSDDDCHTSLIPMGVPMIRALLKENVRVIYKPHPLTGRRSPKAAAADLAIQDLLRADNRRRDARATASRVAGAKSELQRIQAEMDRLSGRGGRGDDAEQTRRARPGDPAAATEWHRLHAEWHRVFWQTRGPVRHNVILKQLPTLYECFNQADMLISDVSSVVADFVASLKPYVLTNAENLPDDEFYAAYTTAGGAYLLDRECTRLPAILQAVREPWHDPMAPHRRALKDYVLGPDRPTSMERFNGAANSLSDRAALHEWQRYLEQQALPGGPEAQQDLPGIPGANGPWGPAA